MTKIKGSGNWGYFKCDNCKKENPCALYTSIRMGLTNAKLKKRIKCNYCNKFNKVEK